MIDGDAVVHELTISATPEAVYAMFVEARHLVRWIGVSADLDAQVGGRFRFEVQPGQYCEGRYLELQPPHRVVFSWGWTDPQMGLPPGGSRVEVDLAPVADGTRLRLVHRDLAGDGRLLHDDGWTRFLARLVAVTGGQEPPAYPTDDPAGRLSQLRQEDAAP